MNFIRKTYCRVFQGFFRAALPILPYRKQMVFDSINEIPKLLIGKKKKSVLLVVDGAVHRLGLTEKLERKLEAGGISVGIYEQNTPNPTIDDVETALKVYHECKAEAIIAVGGGSAMDCAKITGARVSRPKMPVEKMRGILKIRRGLPLLIAVPTTAGTGSETTLAAVITDAKTYHKYPINDFGLIPACAVLEPEMTLGLPPFITATTGMDALTHAVEAYIGRSADKLTRNRSEEAVRLIKENLQEAVHNGKNLEARRGMLRASYLAGGAFTRSYVGYIHGVAHSLGGQYGIAHGLANAVILPQFLEIYGSACEKKLAKLAYAAGIIESTVQDDQSEKSKVTGTAQMNGYVTDRATLTGKTQMSDRKAARIFIDWIYKLNEEFGIPKGFEQIREADILQMADHADKECNPLYPVPALMDAKQLAPVYRQLKIAVATPKTTSKAADIIA